MIDSALYEAVQQVTESLVVEYDVDGIMRECSGLVLKGIAPSDVYKCSNGQYMIQGKWRHHLRASGGSHGPA